MDLRITSRWNENGEVELTLDTKSAHDLHALLTSKATLVSDRIVACLEWTLQRPGNAAEASPRGRTRATSAVVPPLFTRSGKLKPDAPLSTLDDLYRRRYEES